MFNSLLFLVAYTLTGPRHITTLPIYGDQNAALENRVNDLFTRLTNDEKLDILTGTAFTTRPITRLGIRPMAMADAGQGVRGGMPSTEGPATAFPSGVAMAATWDPELVGRIGKAIGEEALNKGTGVQVLLGRRWAVEMASISAKTHFLHLGLQWAISRECKAQDARHVPSISRPTTKKSTVIMLMLK